jgi:long-chain acyl-CoA synthetase
MNERPWLKSYPSNVPDSLAPYPERSVYWLLEEAVARFADRPAVSFFGKRLTYRELGLQAEQLSRALGWLGIRRGDRVALILPNCPQFLIAFYAAARLGAIPVRWRPSASGAVKAYVTVKEGQVATAEEIIAFCRDPGTGLAGYRVPKEVEIRASLPETVTGKVLRRALREQQRETAATGPA